MTDIIGRFSPADQQTAAVSGAGEMNFNDMLQAPASSLKGTGVNQRNRAYSKRFRTKQRHTLVRGIRITSSILFTVHCHFVIT